jgi:hypothetical protein
MSQDFYKLVSHKGRICNIETVLRIGWVGMKESSRGGEFKHDIFDTL